MTTAKRVRKVPDIYGEPGHLIRRAQQIAVSRFHELHGRNVTPIQYAILNTLHHKPNIDQVTLAQLIALDTSTTAEIAARLEVKGWIHREILPRRQRSLTLTEEGKKVLSDMLSNVTPLYKVVLSGLDDDEKSEFMRLLRKMVQLNNDELNVSKPSNKKD